MNFQSNAGHMARRLIIIMAIATFAYTVLPITSGSVPEEGQYHFTECGKVIDSILNRHRAGANLHVAKREVVRNREIN